MDCILSNPLSLSKVEGNFKMFSFSQSCTDYQKCVKNWKMKPIKYHYHSFVTVLYNFHKVPYLCTISLFGSSPQASLLLILSFLDDCTYTLHQSLPCSRYRVCSHILTTIAHLTRFDQPGNDDQVIKFRLLEVLFV